MHPRTTARNIFATRLKEISALGNRVYVSRVYPLSVDKLPCALIYTSDENTEPMSCDPERSIKREIELSIEVLSNGGDAEIDILCELVEQKIAADTFLNDTAEDAFLNSTRIELTGEGDRTRVTATLKYLVTMFVPELNQ